MRNQDGGVLNLALSTACNARSALMVGLVVGSAGQVLA